MFVVRARSCVATVAKSICHVVRMIGKPAGLLVHAIDLITANCSLKPNVSRSHLLYRIGREGREDGQRRLASV